ncbi:hypothetical protein F53441_4920 [Fusarium austroafricanum]|uniref:Uncharacterized protein n=1 Tax=Fusarium austroafricanum TaxID=2364996 RepID=A0A8H4KKY5_9HYPO|nr:hypothetical protein F53441_4920 [Fusarium austroafricanum]
MTVKALAILTMILLANRFKAALYDQHHPCRVILHLSVPKDAISRSKQLLSFVPFLPAQIASYDLHFNSINDASCLRGKFHKPNLLSYRHLSSILAAQKDLSTLLLSRKITSQLLLLQSKDWVSRSKATQRIINTTPLGS